MSDNVPENRTAIDNEPDPTVIARLNDEARARLCSRRGETLVATCGIMALHETTRAQVFETVRTYSAFDEGNDPHEEHDMGIFEVEVNGEKESIAFKFDYYDLDRHYGSPDSSNPALTHRILTVMLMSEY